MMKSLIGELNYLVKKSEDRFDNMELRLDKLEGKVEQSSEWL